MTRRVIIGVSMFLVFCSAGCRLAYLLKAAEGQFRLLYNSVPVENALKGDSIGPDQKVRLRLVACIKKFGEVELGLRKTENYETVYLKSATSPIFFVCASPKDRLERVTWWFPVVGDMPYLGFFNLEDAKSEKEKLVRKDLDVIVGTADSYSTLGWFKDPLTLNLINDDTPALVETILHEMTHSTLYLKGQAEFNEGLAVLVGKIGAYRFLLEAYGPCHPFTMEAKKVLEDERIFCSLLNHLLKRLDCLYNSNLTYKEKVFKREKVFKEWLKVFERRKVTFKTNRYVHFGCGGLNNAYLMSSGLYHRHFNIFEAFLTQKGNSIRSVLAFFQKPAEGEKDMLDVIKRHLSCSK